MRFQLVFYNHRLTETPPFWLFEDLRNGVQQKDANQRGPRLSLLS